MDAEPEIVFTEVPPWITPTLNVVFGSSGTWNSAICAIARPIAWIGLGMPKFWKLWPPLPVNVTS